VGGCLRVGRDFASQRSRSDGLDHAEGTSAGCVLLDAHVCEAGRPALSSKGLGLLVGPAMASEPGGTGTYPAFDGKEPAARGEYSLGLGDASGDVCPVVNGRQRPQNRRGPIREP
jgi:hypothetical protein